MEINVKQELFVNGELLPEVINIDPDELIKQNIIQNNLNLQRIIFEKNCSLNSPPVLSNPFGVFIGAYSYMNQG